jgi:aminoglycoside 6'-N-acetyltransferase
VRGSRVVLSPLQPDDARVLRDIRGEPEVVRWWGRLEDDFPAGDDPDATRFAIRDGDEVVGLIQYGEEPEPEYRHASIDLFVTTSRHGEGLGTEAVGVLLDHLTGERGHHRVTIDPAVDNAAAVRCYEKAGFVPVGVTRRSWRDPDGVWRDSLLMERVTEPGPR